MKETLPKVYLARHGETAWSLSGQHTSRTDIPLTERGERNARSLGERLKAHGFVRVMTSPLQRARRTAELAGFGGALETDPDLVEWDYGHYEGLRTEDIQKERPGWNLFRDGCPHGESFEAVRERADRVVGRLRAIPGDALVFAHGHILRILAARWLGLPVSGGKYFLLAAGSISILSYDHDRNEPAIRLWNDDRHVGT